MAAAGVMKDPNEQVREIVEGAITSLIRMGMERERAAALLAVQAFIRMPSIEARRGLLHLIDSDEFEDPAARGMGNG